MAEAGVAGIVFADRNEQGARAAAEKSKCYAQQPDYRAIAIAVDVTDPSSVQEMVELTIKKYGRIGYSVNSAGVSKHTKPFDQCFVGTLRILINPSAFRD